MDLDAELMRLKGRVAALEEGSLHLVGAELRQLAAMSLHLRELVRMKPALAELLEDDSDEKKKKPAAKKADD